MLRAGERMRMTEENEDHKALRTPTFSKVGKERKIFI